MGAYTEDQVLGEQDSAPTMRLRGMLDQLGIEWWNRSTWGDGYRYERTAWEAPVDGSTRTVYAEWAYREDRSGRHTGQTPGWPVRLSAWVYPEQESGIPMTTEQLLDVIYRNPR